MAVLLKMEPALHFSSVFFLPSLYILLTLSGFAGGIHLAAA